MFAADRSSTRGTSSREPPRRRRGSRHGKPASMASCWPEPVHPAEARQLRSRTWTAIGRDTHLARARRLPLRHPGRQAHLRRPVPDRQPEVPGGRARAGAGRRDLPHARPRRPRRRHRRAGAEVRLPAWSRRSSCAAGSRGRASSRDMAHAPNKGGTVDVDGIKVTLTDANHSSSCRRRHVRSASRAASCFELEDGPTLYFAGDTNVFGDMAADRADLRAGRRRAADRRPLHDGPARGRCRARAARRQALRPVPLRHVPAPHRHARAAARARAAASRSSRPSPAETVEL